MTLLLMVSWLFHPSGVSESSSSVTHVGQQRSNSIVIAVVVRIVAFVLMATDSREQHMTKKKERERRK